MFVTSTSLKTSLQPILCCQYPVSKFCSSASISSTCLPFIDLRKFLLAVSSRPSLSISYLCTITKPWQKSFSISNLTWKKCRSLFAIADVCKSNKLYILFPKKSYTASMRAWLMYLYISANAYFPKWVISLLRMMDIPGFMIVTIRIKSSTSSNKDLNKIFEDIFVILLNYRSSY